MSRRISRLLPVLFLAIISTLPAQAERWMVRVNPGQTDLAQKSSGLKVVRRYRHIPWITVEADEDAAKWLRSEKSFGRLQAVPDQAVQFAALPNDPLLSNQTF